jgi:hypothetical protein
MKSAVKLLGAVAAIATLAVALPTSADAAGRFVARGARVNADGGVTGGVVRGHANARSRAIRAHSIKTDGQGDRTVRSAACAEGAAGVACRAGKTTWQADGAVQHQSGAQWRGANGGSGSTAGSFTRNADGSYSGERNTAASGSRGTYKGTTTVNSASGYARSATAAGANSSRTVDSTYQKGVGGQRTVTCTDSSGAVVGCPTR